MGLQHRSAARVRALLSTGAALAVVTSGGLWGTARAAVPGTAATGPAASAVRWTATALAPGVEVRSAALGNAGAEPVWTVTVQAPATGRLSGAATWAPVGTRYWADDTAARLRAAGHPPRVEKVYWPMYSDTPHGVMGMRVRIGTYATEAAARTVARTVTAAGFHTAVDWTGYDADQPADRQNVHVAVVDPRRFTGTVRGTHDGNVAQRATTSSVAARLGSLVGVNGGFFVTSDADGVQGTQSGLSADDGVLQSMAAGSRAALIVEGGGKRARVADLTTAVTVSAGARHHDVQGINRTPGLVRDCGRPGVTPSERPWQDVTCHISDELVLFTDEFGAPLPTGPGAQAVLDAAGRVVSAGARGGSVPAHGTVVQGIGPAAGWLTAHAHRGERIDVRADVRDTAGRPVRLERGDSVVSAAPTLVRRGRTDIDAATEGVVDPRDLSFGYAWANARQPRTMAGVDARGRLILATVDGRRTGGGSEGFTLQEAASFMRSLGAVDALALDGGGSTAMAVGGVLVTSPSDTTGERAVGGTLQVLPSAPRR
ncbi:phosphodiester glycosidase family protein [Streptomyces sp. NRRL S-340]|uniref:phosphodiester glycosidase family protein n=1 Tax=Streptomyces sp. NRRL S-340 TaxID=1463901 RepID=UPI0005699E29|nr:phosphodiester glycosidase family protein [Streptomyces sp. NRRL S-340]